MLAPFVPYICSIGILLAVLGIVFSFIKKKYAFIPTYVLFILSMILIWLSQLPEEPGSWSGMVYALFGVLMFILTLIVGGITLLIKGFKKIDEIK